MSNEIVKLKNSQIDRRGFLKCMQWAGTAAVWGLAVSKATKPAPALAS